MNVPRLTFSSTLLTLENVDLGKKCLMSLRTLREWNDRVSPEEYYMFNVVTPPEVEFEKKIHLLEE